MAADQSGQDEAAQHQLAEVRRSLRSLANLETSAIVNRAKLGEIAFESVAHDLDGLRALGEEASGLDFSVMTSDELRRLNQRLSQLDGVVQQMFKLRVTDENVTDRKEDLERELREARDQLRRELLPAIVYLRTREGTTTPAVSEFMAEVERAQQEFEDALGRVRRIEEEAGQALESARLAARDTAIGHHAEVFAEAATRNETRAWQWLGATAAMLLATVVLAVILVHEWEVTGDISDVKNVQILLAKALAISAGLLLSGGTARMFRAHSHLAAVSKHRADALHTFAAFSEGAAGDPDVKHKVLLEAAHAIFGHTATGMVSEGGSAGTVEVLDGVSNLIRRSSG